MQNENKDEIIGELKAIAKTKGIIRFISTHPDEDHFGGIEYLDDAMPIMNFYVARNAAIKDDETSSFKRYCHLRDGEHAFYVSKNCSRKWMNEGDDVRPSSGIQIIWPDPNNVTYKAALVEAELGLAFNNMSLIIRYELQGGASALWLGDLETQFMEDITNHVNLKKVDIIFAAHHGRYSGKIPNSWLEKLQPELIILGEVPSRHMHYYTGYQTLTQNSCGDITMDCTTGKVHIYVSNYMYGTHDWLIDEGENKFENYIGTLIL